MIITSTDIIECSRCRSTEIYAKFIPCELFASGRELKPQFAFNTCKECYDFRLKERGTLSIDDKNNYIYQAYGSVGPSYGHIYIVEYLYSLPVLDKYYEY